MLLAIATVGCAESSAPAHVVQSLYVAESVNGAALPVELLVIGTVHRYLDASSIAFETGAQARQVQTIRSLDDANPGVPVLSTNTAYYDVTMSGDTTWLHARCTGPTASCVAPIALVRVGDTYQEVISYEPLRTMTLVRH